MISQTGKKSWTSSSGKPRNRWPSGTPLTREPGFSFIECMVAVIVLTVGMVMIFRAFLFVLDARQYVAQRLYAQQLMADQIDYLRIIHERTNNIKPGMLNRVVKSRVHKQPLEFGFSSTLIRFQDIDSLAELEMSLSWNDRGKAAKIIRDVYLYRDFKEENEKQ